MPHAPRFTPWLLGFFVATALGCDGDEGSSHGTDGGTQGDSGGSPWPPAACEGETTPFAEPCKTELIEACRRLENEADCGDVPIAMFDGGFTALCAWTTGIEIDDADTCSTREPFSRCEAGLHAGAIPCADPCSGGGTGIWDSFELVDGAFVKLPCDTELGELITLFAGTATCAPHTAPPAPDICECAADVCAAWPE